MDQYQVKINHLVINSQNITKQKIIDLALTWPRTSRLKIQKMGVRLNRSFAFCLKSSQVLPGLALVSSTAKFLHL